MQINYKQQDNKLIAELSGELDHHTAEKVRKSLDRIVASTQPQELIVEMSGVTFMDSSGLGVILGRYKKMNEHGGIMKIANPQGHAESIMRMSGVFSIIEKCSEY
ncbi:MAG: anti-sigma factor antagonist [Clostridia bacterium]|nr:anti-sigma factor antagonist [Clostridia bacterium]